MPITSAQLSSALRVKKEFNLVNGDLDLTDLTNFAGLNVIFPNTWATLVKIVDPTGAIIYQNAGFDTDNYTSPDFNNATIRNNAQIKAHLGNLTALGRVGEAEDIGGIIAFLCSKDGYWINGQRIEASGGIAL